MSKSDLDAILETTRRKETSHVDKQVRTARASTQWFLENDHATHPIHNNNALKLLVCGDEGFSAIEADIRKATSTLDLVCWGFDPAMELGRMTPTTDPRLDGYQYWPRGTTYGDLLVERAKEEVQVRLLLWFATGNDEAVKGVIEMLLGARSKGATDLATAVLKRGLQEATANADIPLAWSPMPGFAATVSAPKLQLRNAKPTGKQVRAEYVRAWWHAALSGSIKNLEVRFRETSPAAIAKLKGNYLPTALSSEEELSISLVGTHHQKPILIDYHPGQGKAGAKPNTCGYVMGLNSVTDYWDTEHHLYNDPRRETAYGVGADWLAPWHLKPYRDYAMRVEGEALACLNKNFCTAWDKAKTTHAAVGSKPLLAQRSAIKPQPRGKHRAQIVRTQPEEADATILKTYTQASSNAVNYIYVENQYVQLEHWVSFVKNQRDKVMKDFAAGISAARAKDPKAKLPDAPEPLFLFVVMPQAERDQMIPSTYATLAQMGQATTVRGYHSQVEEMRQGKDPGGEALAKSILKDSLAATPSTSNVAAELNRLKVKTLTAMLMTYDFENQADKLRINKRDSQVENARAATEERPSGKLSPTYGDGAKGLIPALVDKNSAKLPSDVAPGEYSEYNIQPQRYREIYIHSKLMLIDDAFITLGSANLNKRSMAGDSELNIASADYALVKAARQRVWGNLAGNDLDGGDGSVEVTQTTFTQWKQRMKANASDRKNGALAVGPEERSFIHTYDDPRGAPLVRLA